MSKKWTHIQSWHKYPYAIEKIGGVEGWSLTWHHKPAGRSHTIEVFSTPEEAIEFVENVHGPQHDWKACE